MNENDTYKEGRKIDDSRRDREYRQRAKLAPETVDWEQLVRSADELSDAYVHRADLVGLLAQERKLPAKVVNDQLVNHALDLGLLAAIANQEVLYAPSEVSLDE